MYKNNKILAIIPARGGSKGIPKKNIIELGGKPLISHTINQANNSEFITEYFVSTDDEEIINIAKLFGSKIIKRPFEISLDSSKTEECLIHAIKELSKSDLTFDYLVVLEPTSPFRESKTIDNCIKKIIDQERKSLLTVYETKECIGEIDSYYNFKPIIKNQPRRRQERKPLFVESSTVYIVKVDFLLETNSLVCEEWLSYILEKKEAIDINTYDDLIYANFLINTKLNL
ncbi:acylneuraminate cytidylyltransferase family protein [Prochlorococcus sp. AH-716-E17]|nr:acylneuraminate cytidylyltransferase family protein [Prochlorococcus sp. AH-716-E17]